MQKMFTRYFCAVMAVALIIMLGLSYILQSRNAQRHMIENSRLKLDQIARALEANDLELQELTASLKEDYLTRCRAFAYIIAHNPSILDSLDELNYVKTLLNVDELHVINEDGILFSGTVPKYYDMDFRSTKQTAEFLQILDHPGTVLVQDIQPNGAEQKLFQYVGVARQDQPGIVQIGLSPTRLLEAQQRNEIPYIMSRMPVEAGGSLFAVDCATGAFLASSNPAFPHGSLSDLGLDINDIPAREFCGFRSVEGVRTFFVARRYGNLLLVTGQTAKVLYAKRGGDLLLILGYMLLTMLTIIFVINRLLKRLIVNGIHRITDGLTKITDGDLDTVVEVDDNPEFKRLSEGINQMVRSILQATVRVSKVIDMTQMPIGVFELHGDAGRVMATDQLRAIMQWTGREAESLYSDKALFLQAIHGVMNHCPCRDGDVYQTCAAPERWVRIHMHADESGTFGVVADVTKDILEKKKIEHERDYDRLTGLCNINKFRSQVTSCLSGGKPGVSAMVMLDLDHFKQINDVYGHDWGDRYLQAAAGFLDKFSSKRCIAARRSGDEFCLFLFRFDSRGQIEALLDSFYEDIHANELLFPDGSKQPLAISAGLAWYGGGLEDYESLLKAADDALYESKHNGRGMISQFQPPDRTSPSSAPG